MPLLCQNPSTAPTALGPRPTLLKLPSMNKPLHSQRLFLLQALVQLLSDLGTFFTASAFQQLISRHLSSTHPYILTAVYLFFP